MGTFHNKSKAGCALCHHAIDYQDPVSRKVRQHYFKKHPETAVWARGGLRFDTSKALKPSPSISRIEPGLISRLARTPQD